MDLYVSAVEGRLVGRLGSGTATLRDTQIGATYDPDEQGMVWDLDEIVRLSEREVGRFRRYYDKAIAQGALKVRTAAEYEAWQLERAKREEAEQKVRKAEREKEVAAGQKLAAELEAKERAEKDARKKMLADARAAIAKRDAPSPAPAEPTPDPTSPAPEPEKKTAKDPRKVDSR